MTNSINANANRLIVAIFVIVFALPVAGCSSTTLPWPDLSISHDEAEDGLSKNEQSQLEKILSNNQKHHREEAEREIEQR